MTLDETTPAADRIAACRARLDGIAAHSYAEQADVLEHVHEALTAELEDLRRRDRERRR